MLCDEQALSELSWQKIADKNNISATSLKLTFKNKTNIYLDILKLIDIRVEADFDVSSLSETPKDRLFEILMLRFDILNEHREAYKSLFFETFKTPKIFRRALPQFHKSMEAMLRLADANGRDGKGCPPLRTGALALVYLNTVRIWMNDDSPDMAATMAELDKGLSKLDQALDYIPEPLRAFI